MAGAKSREEEAAADAREMNSFQIIASAGEARSLAFEALALARDGKYDEAKARLEAADKAQLTAHNLQTELLQKEASGDHTPVDVFLVHAQDHLMCAMLAVELIKEMVYLYECKRDR